MTRYRETVTATRYRETETATRYRETETQIKRRHRGADEERLLVGWLVA